MEHERSKVVFGRLRCIDCGLVKERKLLLQFMFNMQRTEYIQALTQQAKNMTHYAYCPTCKHETKQDFIKLVYRNEHTKAQTKTAQ